MNNQPTIKEHIAQQLTQWIENNFDIHSTNDSLRLTLKQTCSILTARTEEKFSHKMLNLLSSQEFGLTSTCLFPPLILAHWYAVSKRFCEKVTWIVHLKRRQLEIVTEGEYCNKIHKKSTSQIISYESMMANCGFHIKKRDQSFEVLCGSTSVIRAISDITDASLCCQMFNEIVHLIEDHSKVMEQVSDDGMAVIYNSAMQY